MFRYAWLVSVALGMCVACGRTAKEDAPAAAPKAQATTNTLFGAFSPGIQWPAAATIPKGEHIPQIEGAIGSRKATLLLGARCGQSLASVTGMQRWLKDPKPLIRMPNDQHEPDPQAKARVAYEELRSLFARDGYTQTTTAGGSLPQVQQLAERARQGKVDPQELAKPKPMVWPTFGTMMHVERWQRGDRERELTVHCDDSRCEVQAMETLTTCASDGGIRMTIVD